MTEPRPTRCPICKKPTIPDYKPFCSKRCADADLGHWLSGDYAVAGEPVDPDTLTQNGSET